MFVYLFFAVTPEGASPDEVILAYTVNNLGYTSTCG